MERINIYMAITRSNYVSKSRFREKKKKRRKKVTKNMKEQAIAERKKMLGGDLEGIVILIIFAITIFGFDHHGQSLNGGTYFRG